MQKNIGSNFIQPVTTQKDQSIQPRARLGDQAWLWDQRFEPVRLPSHCEAVKHIQCQCKLFQKMINLEIK